MGVEIHCDALIGQAPRRILESPPAERTSAWLQHQVLTTTDLPGEMSSFDRASLSESVLAVAATWPGARDQEPDEVAFGSVLSRCAELLGLRKRRTDSSRGWLANSTVREVLLDAFLGARSVDRSDEWLHWLRRRHTLSAANLLLAALTSWGSGVDADEFTVDLHPADDTRFVISEQSPGGTGQIESLARSVRRTPTISGWP